MIRESRVTESAQEIVDSFPCIADIRHMSTICKDLFALGVEVCFTRNGGFYLEVCLTVKK